MRLINKTKNITLAEEVIIADTFLKRIKGLLGKKEFKKGSALVIKPCNSIHTFFMRFPIDVLFVSRDNRVVKIIYRLVPFRLTPIYFSAFFAIELPAGTLSLDSVEKNDFLLFE